MAVPFCKDCRHRIPFDATRDAATLNLSKCRKTPSEPNQDYYVTGERGTEYAYCSSARIGDNACGKEGRLFDPVNAVVAA